LYNSAYVFYLLINLLYLFSAPLNWYLRGEYDQIANYVFIYALISFIFLLLVPIILYKFKKKNTIVLSRVKPNFFRLKFIILSLITILILTFFYLDTGIDYSIFFNRINRALPFYQTQKYVIAIIFMQFYFAISIYNLRYLRYFEKTILLLLFLLFAYHEIVLFGARRFTLFIVLFYLISTIGFKNLLQIKYIIPVIFIALFMLIFGGARELVVHDLDFSMAKSINLVLNHNEFTEMGRGLHFYMTKNITGEILQGGKTFIEGLQFIIPREFHPDKPISLTSQFGGVTSIYAELLINFHFFGAFIIILYGSFYYILSLKHNFWSIVFYSYTLDFIRTQFGVILYTFIILYFLYFLFYSNYNYTNKYKEE
jgi:hypothetical protein